MCAKKNNEHGEKPRGQDLRGVAQVTWSVQLEEGVFPWSSLASSWRSRGGVGGPLLSVAASYRA